MASSTFDTVLGIVLIAIGALSLLGWIGLGFIVTIAAVVAIIAGILMLVGKMNGSTLMAILLIVAGVLLLFPGLLDLGRVLGGIIETIAAVILLVLGILKLMGKW